MPRKAPQGHGPLGRALIAAWGGGRRTDRTAKSWYAKLREMTKAPRQGSAAADAVGWNPSTKTIETYLSDPEHRIRPDYEAKIHEAYEVFAGAVWNTANETRQYAIDGMIGSGDRTQERVLNIYGNRGSWETIRSEYLDGSLTPERAEELFITEVIWEDIGAATGEGWDFPGSSYTV